MARQGASYIAAFAKICAEDRGFIRNLRKVRIVSAGEGKCRGELTIAEEHQNPLGTMHGGFIATLVDQMSMFALQTHENGPKAVSVNINVSYFKPATTGDEVIIDARTIRAGKKMAFLEVDLIKKKTGELLVRGSHAVFIVSQKTIS
ncbi:acyl-coenzyme A thioesterase 13-like isoform X1 [Schistocerca americana]|uniref:acyl-coenzyme A thioesterase 13-like isoform X1 n=1 Tax=Schistocerca americana TaxID=7009 RepID=UPI001F4FC4F9|nr:acyl-coenzyme A thioesterase 13-like isoform X1 [Schistocerca americana]XP_049960316.1 acyl-coenzyme A thioesterase 13-like isoform X2 [Schistocerca serialis cubense]